MTNDFVLYGCYADVMASWCRWDVIAHTIGGIEGPINASGPGCG